MACSKFFWSNISNYNYNTEILLDVYNNTIHSATKFKPNEIKSSPPLSARTPRNQSKLIETKIE
jgi:hypothetical protein